MILKSQKEIERSRKSVSSSERNFMSEVKCRGTQAQLMGIRKRSKFELIINKLCT